MARVLASWGVRTLFAYPGTSELPLCEAVVRLGAPRLVNARGDAEAVFLAGGANLGGRREAACLLHAARGTTNALGAIGNLKRNEIPAVVLVGLPSTTSAPYLPPHGEPDLMRSVSEFAKWSCGIAPAGSDPAAAAATFLDALHEADERAFAHPRGPCLVGLPQDLLASRWVPDGAWRGHRHTAASPPPVRVPDEAVAMAATCRNPTVLFDDYLLRYEGARAALSSLGRALEAPVLQVRYTRGPMLFESLPTGGDGYFAGRYDPAAREQVEVCRRTDLLITLEDRNMYPRVVGPLFGRMRIAFTSDPVKTAKNGYLRPGDPVIGGDVVEGIRALVAALDPPRTTAERRGWPAEVVAACAARSPADAFHEARRAVAGALARALARLGKPVIVDDSQMFGGLLAEHYDLFPPGLRVFGDHSGFVGAGAALAAGVALGNPAWDVVCCLGDHGLCNGVKGLFAAAEQRPRLTYVVCNNGGSVSLAKQADADQGGASRLRGHPLLANPPELDYGALAAALGVAFRRVEWDARGRAQRQGAALSDALQRAVTSGGPSLVEVRLPGGREFWGPIWSSRGLDESPPGDQPSAGPRAGPPEQRAGGKQ